MARRAGGDAVGLPPEELLSDRSADEPGGYADEAPDGAGRNAHEAAAGEAPHAPADAGSGAAAEADAPSAVEPQPVPPALEARLRRIESHLESLLGLHRETPGGAARAGEAGQGAARPPLPEAFVEDLKLAKSNLAGLSERVASLERGLSERFRPIEEAAGAVREASEGLAGTGKRLEESTRGIESSLWATGRIEALLETLHRYAFRWTLAVLAAAGAVLVGIGLALAERHGVL